MTTSMSNYYRSTIDFEITLGTNTRLSAAAKKDLKAITIYDDVAALGMFTLELNNVPSDPTASSWSDDTAVFVPGQEIEIKLGYADQSSLTSVIQAEITGLELLFRSGQSSTFLVRGYDKRYHLLNNQNTRTFLQMKDSDIARSIVAEAGLQIETVDTETIYAYVMQHNQTDWDFLQERAGRIGYEVAIEGRTIQFQPPALDEETDVTLELGLDIVEFFPRLTTISQMDAVTVQGWDVQNKAAVMSTVSDLTAVSLGSSRPDVTNGTLSLVRYPVATAAEAEEIAKAQFNNMALAYVTGDGVCYGNPDLKAGTVVSVTDAGERFNGKYYIKSAIHRFRTGDYSSYRTHFSFKRNAI